MASRCGLEGSLGNDGAWMRRNSSARPPTMAASLTSASICRLSNCSYFARAMVRSRVALAYSRSTCGAAVTFFSSPVSLARNPAFCALMLASWLSMALICVRSCMPTAVPSESSTSGHSALPGGWRPHLGPTYPLLLDASSS